MLKHSNSDLLSSHSFNSNHTPRQALKHFFRKRVDDSMLSFLVKTTEKVINVQEPTKREIQGGFHSLYEFIYSLVKGSNVQTPTLMSTVVYLKRLSKILPSNVIGISTTRHRMFIGCLVVTSKNLNDSSPLNKHWKNYCLDMLTLQDINTIEREILELFNWKLEFDESELIEALAELLMPQSISKYSSETPKNSYASAYSQMSTNSIFSSSQKTITSSTRMSNLSDYTEHDHDYQKTGNYLARTNSDFYKQKLTKSEPIIPSDIIQTRIIKHNPTPPIINEPSSNMKYNTISNYTTSDSYLSVNKAMMIRDQEKMNLLHNQQNVHTLHDRQRVISQPDPYQAKAHARNYRIQHPNYQPNYI